jgi:Na+/H+ antiporter NhaD/arsenite permease-like protein
MAWPWAVPFVGILLSIATGPLLFTKTWHAHYGKIALGWAAVTLAPLAAFHGASAALAAFFHTMVAEYMSFMLLLFALYTVAGGILVTGNIRANPWNNTGVLALGTLIASIVGTAGAAMILIRPLIRANGGRKHNAHVVVFFIILAANVGGALSPVGDPPLFVGLLHGVPFFWTTQHLWLQTLIVAVPVLALFFAVDLWYFRKEQARSAPVEPLGLHGSLNLVLMGMIVAAVLLSATGKLDLAMNIAGTEI